MVFSLFFLGPSSPMPTFGSPGPPNNFKANGLACLGELTASGLSFSSHGRVATAPRWPFSYKQAPQGCFKGFQSLEVEGIERNKKKEEMESRRYRIATAIIPYIVFLFCVLRTTFDQFYFLGLNVIYVPLGVPLVIMFTSIFSIYHRRSCFSL